ncbi:MAG: ABC transporter permease [Candidatus Sumerlaeaceae bacterium]
MRKIWFVLVREYIETVRTRTFLVSLMLTPAILGFTIWFAAHSRESAHRALPARTILIADPHAQVTPEFRNALAKFNAAAPQRKIEMREPEKSSTETSSAATLSGELAQQVERKTVSAALLIAPDVVNGSGEVQFFARGRATEDFELEREVQRIVTDAIRQRRFMDAGIGAETRATLMREISFRRYDPVAQKPSSSGFDIAAMLVPFFFMMLMFMGVFGTGQALLTSVIEEKSSRVVEVLLSSVTPFQLMAGKIIGLAGVGLTLIAVWAIVASGAAWWLHMGHYVSGKYIVYFIIYFVLGFVVVASIIAAIGSPCNSLKEAQSAMSIISTMMIIPMLAWLPLAQHPNGLLATTLSFVPPLTPTVMMVRIVSSPETPTYQIVLSIIWLALSAIAGIWIAARIFRVGVLMYGKPASLREILRWVRRS